MIPPSRHRIFVYGTLKRGGSFHYAMTDQRFLGSARTVAGFTLYPIDGHPAMVADETDTNGVSGELWEVDTACLASLDHIEGLDQGLFERRPIPLAPPFDSSMIEAYLFLRSVAGRQPIGAVWPT